MRAAGDTATAIELDPAALDELLDLVAEHIVDDWLAEQHDDQDQSEP
ncbi:MAG: hypothetical protein U5P41_07315 [Gammaproteobacteria bacterium]|nr:hypothetical protein [Gammaproteobacteria bacterium]